MASDFYEASFGGIRLWCASIETDNSRSLVVHKPTRGSVHAVQDRGLGHLPTNCELLFDDMRGVTMNAKTRFDAFRALVEDGEPHVFSHPLLGSYLARVGQFRHRITEQVISASVEFVPDELPKAVTPANAGASAQVGEGAVNAAADAADEALAEFELESDVTDACRESASFWTEEEPNTRDILVDVAQLSSFISDEIVRLELDSNIQLWPAYRAMVMLSDSVLAAGRAATSDVSRIITLRIGQPVSLRRLVSRLYGGFESDERYEQVMQLNDIATPAWLEAGFELRIPQPPPARRSV